MRIVLCVLALVFTAGAAAAASGSIDSCEKIKDPDAYNRCLASFGPAARTGGATRSFAPRAHEPSPPAAARERDAEKPAVRGRGRRVPAWLAERQAEGRARAFGRAPRGMTVTRGAHGRVRTTIEIPRRK